MTETVRGSQDACAAVLDASMVRGQTVRLPASSLAPSPESPALPVPAPASPGDIARLLDSPELEPLALELPTVPGFDLNRILGITAPCVQPRPTAPSSPPKPPATQTLVLTHVPLEDDAPSTPKSPPQGTQVSPGLFTAAQEEAFRRQVQQMRESTCEQNDPSSVLPPKPTREPPVPAPPTPTSPQEKEQEKEQQQQQEQEQQPQQPPPQPPQLAATETEEETSFPIASPKEPPEKIKSLPVAWEELPLTVEPRKALDFGLGRGGVAHVDEAVHATLTLCNATGRALSFRFVSRANAQYAARYSVETGTLASAESLACTLTVVPLCTCVVASHEVLVVWDGECSTPAPPRRVHAPVAFSFPVAPSTRLDAAEVVLAPSSAPLARTPHAVVLRGLYRACPVAVKVLTAHTPDAYASLRRERAVLDALRCPFVVAFVGAATGPHLGALLTELCPYGSLEDILLQQEGQQKEQEQGQPQQQQQPQLPLKMRVRIVADAARGLAYLHRARLTHRAVCARHVLVATLDAGATCAAKLSGLGRVAGAHVRCAVPDLRDAATSRTVLAHMAPELLLPAVAAAAMPGRCGACDPQPHFPPADVYALSMLMCRALALQPPFAHNTALDTPLALAHAVVTGTRPILRAGALPPPLARLMQQCWALDPAARPDAPTVVQQLLSLL